VTGVHSSSQGVSSAKLLGRWRDTAGLIDEISICLPMEINPPQLRFIKSSAVFNADDVEITKLQTGGGMCVAIRPSLTPVVCHL